MKPRSTHLPLLQSLVDFLCFFLGFRFATPQAIIRPRLRRSRASALGLGLHLKFQLCAERELADHYPFLLTGERGTGSDKRDSCGHRF